MATKKPKMVKVYYCKCEKAVELVATLPHADTNKSTIRAFKEAEKWGRKIETMTLEEFRKKDFLCLSVPDCPDPTTTRFYPKNHKNNE